MPERKIPQFKVNIVGVRCVEVFAGTDGGFVLSYVELHLELADHIDYSTSD
jgi:hypothetical protein